MIRDRYSKKTKGYGFVSFKEPKDFMNAMREMNGELEFRKIHYASCFRSIQNKFLCIQIYCFLFLGRYIGNRPVKLRKSTWKDRQLLVVKKKEKEKKRLGFK